MYIVSDSVSESITATCNEDQSLKRVDNKEIVRIWTVENKDELEND